MKDFILKCSLYITRAVMNFIYFFIKIFPIKKNKVLMISRQSDKINIDFEMLRDEIAKKHQEMNVKILCKKIPKSILGKIGYCFYIIYCMYHIATSAVCIVDGYVIPVSVLKHKKKLIIVQIWHAMGATKKFGRQVLDKNEGNKTIVADIMKMHKNYTFITCTSHKTKEFYEEAFGTQNDKILVLGMARIDYLLEKDKKINTRIEHLVASYPILREKKNILYVPTFRKGKGTNISNLIHAIDNEKYNLIIRLHPLDSTKVDEKYTVSQKFSTLELLKVADYIITDYSAIAFEACVIDKPVFFYLYDMEEYEQNRGLNIQLKEEMESVTSNDINKIMDIIQSDSYDTDSLEKFKNKYVETADTRNSERIINEIIKQMEDKNGEEK